MLMADLFMERAKTAASIGKIGLFTGKTNTIYTRRGISSPLALDVSNRKDAAAGALSAVPAARSTLSNMSGRLSAADKALDSLSSELEYAEALRDGSAARLAAFTAFANRFANMDNEVQALIGPAGGGAVQADGLVLWHNSRGGGGAGWSVATGLASTPLLVTHLNGHAMIANGVGAAGTDPAAAAYGFLAPTAGGNVASTTHTAGVPTDAVVVARAWIGAAKLNVKNCLREIEGNGAGITTMLEDHKKGVADLDATLEAAEGVTPQEAQQNALRTSNQLRSAQSAKTMVVLEQMLEQGHHETIVKRILDHM
ncbi:hypothetical protein FACS189481_5320 [Clostridia bacterium]|nr:hypothetical protein FACS189481_5320 [Clostridia bacterium]